MVNNIKKLFMTNSLKRSFNKDNRGLPPDSHFIKDVMYNFAIITYYGFGESYCSLFEYNKEEGWKIVKILDWYYSDFDKPEVMEKVKELVVYYNKPIKRELKINKLLD